MRRKPSAAGGYPKKGVILIVACRKYEEAALCLAKAAIKSGVSA
jgi:hypothetical protein